ncbi:MAG TPA: 6-phosphogluconolactonase, partial [Gemmatimonadales bacterium]|nr:6-phosphogluconolactonase [Gemmatimonadales bacterium]
MSELIVASSPEALAGLAAEWLHREVTRAIEAPGRCSLCLAGGRTPAAAYRKLAALPLEWEKVEVFFGDERAVPSDDPESNYRMVRETLLDRVPIPPAQVHRMQGERANRAAAAAAYERTLPPRLDLLVLGIGSDGHTASLFPGSP